MSSLAAIARRLSRSSDQCRNRRRPTSRALTAGAPRSSGSGAPCTRSHRRKAEADRPCGRRRRDNRSLLTWSAMQVTAARKRRVASGSRGPRSRLLKLYPSVSPTRKLEDGFRASTLFEHFARWKTVWTLPSSIRLARSAGNNPARATARRPVAWIAGSRAIDDLKPIDNPSKGWARVAGPQRKRTQM